MEPKTSPPHPDYHFSDSDSRQEFMDDFDKTNNLESVNLDNLNGIIDDLSKNIQTNLNSKLAVTSENLKDLVTGFEKGNNITKKLATNISKAQIENRKLGLDQNKFQGYGSTLETVGYDSLLSRIQSFNVDAFEIATAESIPI